MLRPIDSATVGMGEASMGLAWEEFLSHCEIRLPPIEGVGLADSDHGDTSAILPPDGSECAATVPAEALAKKRVACLQEAVKELSDRNEATQRDCSVAIDRWNLSSSMQPTAVDLLRVLNE